MRVNTIIDRYIFRELIPPFTITLVFLTFIFLMTRIPQITNMVVNYNTKLSDVFLLILYTLPRFMEFTLPMSVMISLLLIFMRMSEDNEIIALKAGGITVYRLLVPVIIFCIFGSCLTFFITLWAEPWGNRSIKDQGIKIARSSFDIALKERQFNNKFNKVMIYINSKNIRTKQLKDVYIEDSRIPGKVSISIAPRGVFLSDPGTASYTLRLYNGMINQVNLATKSVNTVYFNTYDINLSLEASLKRAKHKSKDIDEMDIQNLIKFIEKISKDKKLLNAALMDINERFSIPFACFPLGLLTMALGLQSGFSKRSSGLGLGLFFFLFYYLLLAAGWSLGSSKFYPPAVAMWTPDFIMAIIAVYMFKRIADERPLKSPLFIHKFVIAIKKFPSAVKRQ